MSKNIFAVLVEHDSDNEVPVMKASAKVVQNHRENSKEGESSPILSFRDQLLRDKLYQKKETHRKDTADSENSDCQEAGKEKGEQVDSDPATDYDASVNNISWRAGRQKEDSESNEIISVDDYVVRMRLDYSFLKSDEIPAQPVRQNRELKIDYRAIFPKPKDQPVFAQRSKNRDALIRQTTNIMQVNPAKPYYQKRRRSPPKTITIEDNEINFPALA